MGGCSDWQSAQEGGSSLVCKKQVMIDFFYNTYPKIHIIYILNFNTLASNFVLGWGPNVENIKNVVIDIIIGIDGKYS